MSVRGICAHSLLLALSSLPPAQRPRNGHKSRPLGPLAAAGASGGYVLAVHRGPVARQSASQAAIRRLSSGQWPSRPVTVNAIARASNAEQLSDEHEVG